MQDQIKIEQIDSADGTSESIRAADKLFMCEIVEEKEAARDSRISFFQQLLELQQCPRQQ